MKIRNILLSVVGFVVAGAAATAHALHTLHTIEYAVHFDTSPFTMAVAAVSSSRKGAALITIALALLVILCLHLWRQAREPRRDTTILSDGVHRTVEEDEEIHETTSNRLFGIKRVRVIKRRRRVS